MQFLVTTTILNYADKTCSLMEAWKQKECNKDVKVIEGLKLIIDKTESVYDTSEIKMRIGWLKK